ncbi:HAD-IC family P-type ATPase [Immundisolibacter sp.]
MNHAAPSHIHTLSTEAVYAALHSGPDGLSTAQARRRLAAFGSNRLQAPVRRRRWRELLASFTHFFALVLWLAAALAFGLAWRDPGSGLAALGYAIVAVIVLNGLFSCWQVYQAERVIAALEKLLPQRVRLRRDGEVCELSAEAVVPGDLLLLSGGDRVPADCRRVAGFGVQVNSSALTGESLPRPRSPQPCEAARNGDADNLLQAGTVLLTGEAQALVFATGMQTEFGQIARSAQAAPPAASPLQREIARLSRLVTGLAIGLGVLCFAIGGLAGLPAAAGLTFAIGIIVANVPEGLLPIVTLALAMAARRMAARQALVRHLPAVETLGAATVILTDKTGILTQNRMTVRRLFVADAVVEVPPPGPVVAAQRALFDAAGLCHDLKGDPRREATLLGDPLGRALLRLARAALGRCLTGRAWTSCPSIPSDSGRAYCCRALAERCYT